MTQYYNSFLIIPDSLIIFTNFLDYLAVIYNQYRIVINIGK